jgi:amidase
MATYTISRMHLVDAFSATMEPVLTVDRGDTVRFEVVDTERGRIESECDLVSFEGVSAQSVSGGNPATGPVAVRGATVGDVLVVAVDRIDLDSRGWACAFPGIGPLRTRIDHERTWFMDIKETSACRGELEVPLRPMVGTIGVAPGSGTIGNDFPGPHGGNLDNRYVRPGAIVYLPVRQPGGLLALGDLHAAMGDGELTGSGLEVGGIVTVRMGLIPARTLRWPVVETDDAWYVHGAGPTWTDAAALACDQAAEMLEREWDVAPSDVPLYLTLAGDLGVCQACQPSPFPVVLRLGVLKSAGVPGPFRPS